MPGVTLSPTGHGLASTPWPKHRVPASASAAGTSAAGSAPWRRALVYGLGVSGRAAVALLRAHGVDVVIVERAMADDEAARLRADDGVRLLLGELRNLPEDLTWSDLDGVVVSPGVPLDRPLLDAARAAGLPVIGEIELAYPFLAGSFHRGGPSNAFAGVTGSNGKSTVVMLLGAILDAAGHRAVVCGNFGDPLAAQVPAPNDSKSPADDRPTHFVVELSSFQLESVATFRCDAAALLNLTPDHLDRHGTLAAYLEAKLRIFERQRPTDIAVLNIDDPTLASVVDRFAGATASDGEFSGRLRTISTRGPVADGCWLDGDRVVEVAPGGDDAILFTRADLPLPAPHDVENAMAAALLARALGASPEQITRGLRGVRGLAHRLERVATHGDVTFYDDSKGTNPAATMRSLDAFEPGRLLLILGGRHKGGSFGELAERVIQVARRVYLIGEAAGELGEALAAAKAADDAAAANAPFAGADDRQTLERAVAAARADARPGDAVVLSPACASFDQFRDYRHRGRVFQSCVFEDGVFQDGAFQDGVSEGAADGA